MVEGSSFQDVAEAEEADSGGSRGTASVPRRCSEGAAVGGGNWTESIPLAVPGLPPVGRRIAAAAPKLIRRWKGVTGAVRDALGESSSSIAFSSKSELVEVLARRAKPVALVGEVPVMPRVVVDRDSLRRCSLMAAVVTALGMTGVPAMELLRWNS